MPLRQISVLAVQHYIMGKLYTIYRSAAALVGFYAYIFEEVDGIEAQRFADGDRMAHAGLRAVGGYHHHFAGNPLLLLSGS